MVTPIANQLNYALPDPIGVDQLKRRNALAERDQVLQEQNALSNQDLVSMQKENMHRNWMSQDENSRQQIAGQIGGLAQQALASGDPKSFVMQALGNPQYQHLFQAVGLNPQQINPDAPDFQEHLQTWASFAPQQKPMEVSPGASIYDPNSKRSIYTAPGRPEQGGFSLGAGETRYDASGKPIASRPAAPKSDKSFRTLSPEEVTQAGLPPGTAAQQDESTGQINVLSKRDATGGLSQKDAMTARTKLNTVKLARQQLNNIRSRFEGLKGTMSAGAFGQGSLPTEGGQSFDRSVDQMRSTLTALTRTPGVGAMSDYETKLDQSKFPSRKDYESVTQQQIDDLDGMLNAIESGYGDMMSGGSNAQAPQSGAQQGQPRAVRSIQEAMSLPPGTKFVTPDGRVKVR